jgi:hypothetical protein
MRKILSRIKHLFDVISVSNEDALILQIMGGFC